MSSKYLGSAKESFTNSVGTELCWGWSPAVDFLALLEKRGVTAAGAGSAKPKKKPVVVAFDEDGFPIVDDGSAPAAASSSGKEEEEQQQQEPINILLMGAADIRHIMLTLSRTQRTELGRSKRPIRFFIFEPSLRVHCRHLLFLQMLLVDLVTLSELEDRVSMVMEIFGNSMIRDVTAASFKGAAQAAAAALELEDDDEESLLLLLADDGDQEKQQQPDSSSKAATTRNNKQKRKVNTKLASWLDWSHTKAREKDFVAAQLLLWTRDRTSVDIVNQWDTRVRSELAERYDNRVNIFDWEFNFGLLDYSQMVRFPEYREFRKMGMAFDYCRINPRRGFRYDYTVPNKSLAMFNARTGKGVYMGDVKNGPFFALGHDTENTHLKKREVDGTTIYGSGIIAMHTVRGWLYELVTGGAKPFPTDIEHKIAWEDEKNYNFLPSDAPEPHVEFTPQVPPCSFSFVGLDVERFYERIARESGSSSEDGFFDAVFVGATCTQWMTPSLFKIVKRKTGCVVAETLKFVIDAKDEAKEMFEGQIREMAGKAGWVQEKEMTEQLHVNQMAPKSRPDGMEMDAAMKRAHARQKIPHQVVLVAQKKE